MNGYIPWYQSQTIWASILQILLGFATSTGAVTSEQAEIVGAQLPGLIIGLITATLGLYTLYQRVISTKQIVGTEAEAKVMNTHALIGQLNAVSAPSAQNEVIEILADKPQVRQNLISAVAGTPEVKTVVMTTEREAREIPERNVVGPSGQ